jgi:hypothetical protein
MAQGFFPASPYQPRIAFALEVMKFHHRMNSVAKIPMIAFSDALAGSLTDSGVSHKVQNTYYAQLQACAPYFDVLLRKIERITFSMINRQPPDHYTMIETPKAKDLHELLPGEAHPFLHQRCRACFGRRHWGGDPNK